MRLRLILSFALVVLVAVLSVLLIVRQGAAREVTMFMARGAMVGLDELAADLEAYYQGTGSWAGAEVFFSDFHAGRGQGMMMGGPRVRLADRQGTVLADSRGEPTGRLSTLERQAALELHGQRGEVVGLLLSEGGGMMNHNNERQLLSRLTEAGWIAAGIAGGLALVLALLLSYGLLKPVQALTQAAAKMAAGDLSQRVAVRGKDELSTLGRAFNHMAASLEQAEQNRLSMTADIAHELRTPIAIQRAHLEALQDGIYPLTIENLQPVLDQTELLTRLVEDLRTLALADAGELRLERSPTDLPALVRRVVERFQPEAETRLITLSFTNYIDHEVHLMLDSGRVGQILNNLLSNALRYTPENGTVRLELRQERGSIELSVIDSGPGIPPEAMPRLFERFFRADKSRSRGQGGTGLGLAIARQLALAHGGDLLAANHLGSGAVFRLRLPA